MNIQVVILRALREHFKGLVESSAMLKQQINSNEGRYSLPATASNFLARLYDNIETLVKEFNNAAEEFSRIPRSPSIKMTFDEVFAGGRSVGGLDLIIIRSRKAINFIESITLSLSSTDIDRLSSIRKQIEENILNPTIKLNLNLSIKELEAGHFLASCLITARIFDYSFSKIPETSENNDGHSFDRRIRYLVDQGLIEKKREHVQSLILKASKKSRNFLSHNIDGEVQPSDALSLLGDTVFFIEIVQRGNLV